MKANSSNQEDGHKKQKYVKKRGESSRLSSGAASGSAVSSSRDHDRGDDLDDVHPKLRGCDPQLIEKIELEIIDTKSPITFNDISGLEFAKTCVDEAFFLPLSRPELFTGLLQYQKRLLLFGPPGRLFNTCIKGVV